MIDPSRPLLVPLSANRLDQPGPAEPEDTDHALEEMNRNTCDSRPGDISRKSDQQVPQNRSDDRFPDGTGSRQGVGYHGGFQEFDAGAGKRRDKYVKVRWLITPTASVMNITPRLHIASKQRHKSIALCSNRGVQATRDSCSLSATHVSQ